MRRGPVCEAGAAQALHLWLETAPRARYTVRAGTRVLAAGEVGPSGGQRVDVTVQPADPALSVAAELAGRRGQWQLRLRPAATAPWLDAAQAARRSGAPGALASAAGELRARLAGPLPDDLRTRALRALAYIQRRQVGIAAARPLYEEAIQRAAAAGLASDEAEVAMGLAYALYDKGHYAQAMQVLQAHQAAMAAYPEGQAQAPYYQGLLADDTGDLRGALALYSEAAERSARLGMVALSRNVRAMLATTLARLGRGTEAARTFSQLLAEVPQEESCLRAEVLNNLGWSRIVASPAGTPALNDNDPRPPLLQALSLRRGPCPDPQQQANVLDNLARAALGAGDTAAAGEWLGQSRAVLPHREPVLEVDRLDIEGQIALATGRSADAAAAYARLGEISGQAAYLDGEWRSAAGRAEALRTAGQARAALDAYAGAEALLDRRAALLPVGVGAGHFLGGYERATGRYVELLLAQGQRARALEVVRQARVRALLTLEFAGRVAALPADQRRRWDGALAVYAQERAALDEEVAGDWRLPADELAAVQAARERRRAAIAAHLDEASRILGLDAEAANGARRPPGPGELLFTCYPLPAGWTCFAAADQGVTAAGVGPLPATPGDLGQRLLSPFAAQVRRARLLRVLPYGALQQVDFHALSLPGDPQVLVQRLPVVYALDLPLPADHNDAAPGRHALVVSDPGGDLAEARQAAAEAAAALGGGGWTVAALRGAAEHGAAPAAGPQVPPAAAPAVRAGLDRADLFFYAGHATGEQGDPGPAAWQGALVLADGALLTVGDVLLRRRVPPWVVLVSCEAGRPAEALPLQGVGPAQAFLLRGSSAVIAATRRVRPGLGAALAAELLRHGLAAPRPDLVTALQRAQQALLATQPEWAAFRVFVP